MLLRRHPHHRVRGRGRAASRAALAAMSAVGEKTVRRVFDAFRATGQQELDITDGSYLDWGAWIQTSFATLKGSILGPGIKKAELKYNTAVRDTNRPGLSHEPWLYISSRAWFGTLMTRPF